MFINHVLIRFISQVLCILLKHNSKLILLLLLLLLCCGNFSLIMKLKIKVEVYILAYNYFNITPSLGTINNLQRTIKRNEKYILNNYTMLEKLYCKIFRVTDAPLLLRKGLNLCVSSFSVIFVSISLHLLWTLKLLKN